MKKCYSMEIIFLFFSPSVEVVNFFWKIILLAFYFMLEKCYMQKNVASANTCTEYGFFWKIYQLFFFYVQLTISYVESLVPTRERQKQLMRQYCFECDCPLCQNQEKVGWEKKFLASETEFSKACWQLSFLIVILIFCY